MSEEMTMQEKLEEAYKKGQFEATVMTHLTEIKSTVQDLKSKQNGFQEKLDAKICKDDFAKWEKEVFTPLVYSVQKLNRFMYIATGVFLTIQILIKIL